KVTAPVGTPAPGATAVTVAVKRTDRPWPTGLADATRATAPAARPTDSDTAADELGAKVVLPWKDAVSACGPTPRKTGAVAWPAGLAGALPSAVVPSKKVTRPAGVPAGEATLAVSSTVCPKTAVAVEVRSAVVVAAAPCPSPRSMISPVRP